MLKNFDKEKIFIISNKNLNFDYKKFKKKVRIIYTKEIWLDQDSDELIHSKVLEIWDMYEKNVDNIGMFKMKFFSDTISILRYIECFKRAKKLDYDVILLDTKNDFLDKYIIKNFINIIKSNDHSSYETHGSFANQNLIKFDNKFEYLKIKKENYHVSGHLNKIDKLIKGDDKSILIFFSVDKNSPYWSPFKTFVRLLKENNFDTKCLLIHDNLLSKQEKKMIGVPSLHIENMQIINPLEIKKSIFMKKLIKDTSSKQFQKLLGSKFYGKFHLKDLIVNFNFAIDHEYLPLNQTNHKILNILNSMKPKFIITFPHFNPAAHLILKYSKINKIKSFSAPLVTIDSRKSSLVGWDIIDFVGCYGNQCVKALKKVYGENIKTIKIGNLFKDAFRSRNKKNIYLEIKRKLKLTKYKKNILVATSHYDLNEIEWIEKLSNWIKNEDIGLILKVHPSFKDKIYKSIIDKKYKNVRVIENNFNIEDLFVVCDLCITDFSTVGSYSIIANKPLIVANFKNTKFISNNYVRYGVAWEVKNFISLKTTINFIFRKNIIYPNLEKRNHFLNEYSFYNEESSGDRFVKMIHDKMKYLLK